MNFLQVHFIISFVNPLVFSFHAFCLKRRFIMLQPRFPFSFAQAVVKKRTGQSRKKVFLDYFLESDSPCFPYFQWAECNLCAIYYLWIFCCCVLSFLFAQGYFSDTLCSGGKCFCLTLSILCSVIIISWYSQYHLHEL